jgi:GNAT superfamily N-acetyltransferase
MPTLSLDGKDNHHGEVVVSQGTCAILWLFVVTEHRQRGVGTRLLQKAEEFLWRNGCKTASLQVFRPAATNNLTATAGFYTRRGYQHSWLPPGNVYVKKLDPDGPTGSPG